MNGKLILFSAIIMAVIGAIIGMGWAEMRSYAYYYRSSSSLRRNYVIVGTGIGFLIGTGLESVRELKKQQDREESLRNYLHTYLSLCDRDNTCDK
jgi:hypothetical protein